MADDGTRHGMLLLVGTACLLMAYAAAQTTDVGLDVCPANAKVKALPFLKAAKPGALSTLLPAGSAITIDMTKVTDFAKTTLVPMIGANAVFFVLALLFLLIFILWRLLRWCCYILCCRGSCDAKRQKRDPYLLLFGKGTKVIKGTMLMFGLVAIAFAVYGLATVDKNIADQFFGVVVTIVAYVDKVASKLDNLLGSNGVSGVNGIIDDFQAIVTNRINITGFNYHLTAVGGFLDGVPQPAAMSTAITALNTKVKTTLVSSLNTLGSGLPPTFDTDITTMNAGLNGNIAPAYTNINNMHTLLNNVDTAINNIPNWGDAAPGPGGGVLNALKPEVDAAYSSATTVATAWLTVLNGLPNALDSSVGTKNPYANLLAKIATVEGLIAQVKADIPLLVASITSMDSQYTATGSVSIAWLLRQLQLVDADVLALTGGMKTAYDKLSNSSSQLAAFFNNTPTPMTLAANLTTFSSGLPATTSLATLKTELNTAQTALFVDFPAASTAAYKSWLAGIITMMTSLITATPATGPLGALNDAINVYQTTPNAANWATLLTAKQAYTGLTATLLDNSHLASSVLTPVTGVVADYATKASAAPWTPGPFAVNMANFQGSPTAATYVTQTQNQISTGMPDVTSTVTDIDGVALSFAALGSPPSQVTTAPRAQLADIQSSAITTGNSVKDQITSVVTSFRSSTQNLKAQVVDRADSLQDTYEAPARQYDGYRYIAAMVLYGISVLFVTCVLASAAANYHFGANLSTLWLLLITVLYLLLALLMTVLVSVLFLACSELEPLALRLAPATFTPLLRYYFKDEGTSVTAVLKSANLIDVDAVMADMTRSQSDVMSSLTGQFTFRPGPLAVIGRINTTITNVTAGFSSLLDMASCEELMPVYSEVKGFICCAVPGTLGSMWTGLTFAGIFSLALIICTFFYIGRIDKAPRKDCCGCTCHTHSKYVGTVTPADMLPQYNTPGLDNPMGAYNAGLYGASPAAFAMEMPGSGGWSAEEGGGITHVSVNRPGSGQDKGKGY